MSNYIKKKKKEKQKKVSNSEGRVPGNRHCNLTFSRLKRGNLLVALDSWLEGTLLSASASSHHGAKKYRKRTLEQVRINIK